MKSNITLKLDSALLREARIIAAEQGTSLSGMVSERLEDMVRERRAYTQAMNRALARLKDGFDLNYSPAKSRDELHER